MDHSQSIFCNDNFMRYHFTLIRLTNIAKSHVTKFWPRCRDSYKDDERAQWVQPLRTANLVGPRKGEGTRTCDPARPWLYVSLETPKDTHVKILLEHFIIAKQSKLFDQPAVTERVKHTEVSHMVESYVVFKINN